MRNSFERILDLAEAFNDFGDTESLKKLCRYFGPFMKKHAHFIPDERSETPDFFKKNMDYADYEGSPYRGDIGSFLKKFPGGIADYLKWRKENKEKNYEKSNQREKKAHLIPEKGDDVDKFEKEPHLYSDEGLDKFKSVEEFLKKYRENNKDEK